MTQYSREEIQQAMIRHKQEALAGLKRNPPQAVVENLNRRIALLEALLLKLHRGEIDMAKLNILLSDAIYNIEDIRKIKGQTGTVAAIIELCEQLKPGEFKPLNPETVNPNSFYQSITRLRKDKRIPEDVLFVRTKQGMFIGRTGEKTGQ